MSDYQATPTDNGCTSPYHNGCSKCNPITNCKGYEESYCCGAYIDTNTWLCSKCNDHSNNLCYDCADTDRCDNKIIQ